jgi:1-phosphatidylinositol-3-phosphate 5-kinase
LKPGKKSRETESKIPRSVPQVDSRPTNAIMVNGKDGKGGKPRVYSFANHFEQLSREFEKERIKEKKKLLAKRPKAILAASRPIVEVFKDAETAAKDEDVGGEVSPTTNEPDRMVGSVESGDKLKAYDSEPEPEPAATGEVGQEGSFPPAIELPEGSQGEERPPPTPNTAKDSDIYGSDEERSTFGDTDSSSLLPSISDVLRPVTEVLDDQHGRSSLMKVLSNFWNEKSSSGWPDLEWPL